MFITPTLDIPNDILAGLLKGELVRTGGVIQWAKETPHAGQIVMWLREAGMVPAVPQSVAPVFGQAAQLLGLVGSVASVVNLGATVAFGVVLYRKLANVENQLKAMDGKIDQLQWTVEAGFVTVLNSITEISLHHEIEMKAKLKSAAQLAWEAQQFDPASQKRITQFGHAMAQVTEAHRQLQNHCLHEIPAAIEWMQKHVPTERLAIPEVAVGALRRFRQTCLASALRASIQAETGDPMTTAASLEKDQQLLWTHLQRLGTAFVNAGAAASDPENSIYAEMLDSAWCGKIPAQRIDMWASRFDEKVGGLAGVLELARGDSEKRAVRPFEDIEYTQPGFWDNLTSVGYRGFKETIDKHREKVLAKRKARMEERKDLPVFLDLLDGAYEDVDRISGYVSEYRTAGQHKLTLQEYRDKLALQDCEPEQKSSSKRTTLSKIPLPNQIDNKREIVMLLPTWPAN